MAQNLFEQRMCSKGYVVGHRFCERNSRFMDKCWPCIDDGHVKDAAKLFLSIMADRAMSTHLNFKSQSCQAFVQIFDCIIRAVGAECQKEELFWAPWCWKQSMPRHDPKQ